MLTDANGKPRERAFLAISGGGDDGAYGAGLLSGWSARGDRPEFAVVTGVSTGALSAPFVFLGPEYDAQLKKIYTETSAGDVFQSRGFMAAVADDAMANSTPLRNRITSFVDAHMVQRLAAEYERGRILLILTTNLDQGRSVIWNVGAIAASGHPRSRELIVDILLASAAVPGVFPPVMINVTVDGKNYQEMHVDGGAIAQAFLYPASFSLKAKVKELGVKNFKPVAYIIRNGRLYPARGERRAPDIEDRPAGHLDDDGIERRQRPLPHVPDDASATASKFNLAYIEDDFHLAYKGPFDKDYMNALYDHGYQVGIAGYVAHDTARLSGRVARALRAAARK